MKGKFKRTLALVGLSAVLSFGLSYAAPTVSPGLKSLAYTMEGDVKVFHLTAEEVTKVIFDDKKDRITKYVKPKNRLKGHKETPLNVHKKTIKGLGYNGSIPGPTIEVNEGDKVKIIFHNKLKQPSSVHWHGLVVPNAQDGTGGTTQPVVPPGGTWTYQFTVKQSGTFMYHPGFNDTVQVRKGLGGMFISHPKNEHKKVDKDFTFLFQIWSLPLGKSEPVVFSMDPNWFTFNGLVMPNIPALVVNQGDRVRVRFGNLSEMSHPIHLHGYTFNVVGTEGGPIPINAQWPGATVNIAPGQTRDIEFVADNPGVWRFHCHKILHIANNNMYWKEKQPNLGLVPLGGMFTYLYVKPKG